MKLSELIDILAETMRLNGDMEVVGMVHGVSYEDIEINCPDVDSPLYIELYGNATIVKELKEMGVTLHQISKELNYRERANIEEKGGWDDALYFYTTAQLAYAEENWK